MNRTWVASAIIAAGCLVGGMALADHEPPAPGNSGASGGGFGTGGVASDGRNGDAHFDGRGRDAPLINPSAGNAPSGGLPGFGTCTSASGKCGGGG